MEPTSISLIDRLQRQPLEADWARLVALYRPFVERFIRFDAALAADAEDICQNVMAKLVQHLGSFRRQRDGSFRAWLKTITANEVNSYWRRRARRRTVGGEEAQFLSVDLADPRNELSQRWDQEYRGHVLRQLERLVEREFSPKTWQAFRLRVLSEKSTEEVAAMLEMSKNAVDIAKSRVLARLRAESAGLLDD
jgi:RNA polymerase sigma-70 factor, ECF subfamily